MRLTFKTHLIFLSFLLASCLMSVEGAWAQPGEPDTHNPGELARGNGPDAPRGGFVSRLDRDGDGRVSRSEFDGPPDRFDLLDRNHDGYLTEDERPGLFSPGNRPPLSRQDVQVNPAPAPEEPQRPMAGPEAPSSGESAQGKGPDAPRGGFVSRLDRDGDGRVSRSEFDGPPNRFDLLDRNHDGYLTEDERPGLPPLGNSPLPSRQDVQVNPAPAPEKPQAPIVIPEAKEKATTYPWFNVFTISVVAALILALVWGLYASRRLRKVKDVVASLDPHLLGVNIDSNIIITEVTEALCKATGFRYRDLVGKPLMALGSHIADNPTAMQDMWNRIQRGISWKGEVKLIRKNGSVIWADAVISPLRRKKEKSSGYRVFYQDISKRKHYESLSMRDALTGLFNRRYFDEVAPLLLQKARRERHVYVLCILDVDNFKAYNDTYGHPAGDRVLAAIGKELTDIFQRRDDMVFRLGGEEFGAIFVIDDKEEPKRIAEKTLGAMRSLKIEHQKNPPGIVTVSLGMKIVDADDTDPLEAIYQKADHALYEAKQTGRDRFIIAKS